MVARHMHPVYVWLLLAFAHLILHLSVVSIQLYILSLICYYFFAYLATSIKAHAGTLPTLIDRYPK